MSDPRARELLARSLREIERLRGEVARLESAARAPIAIVGVGCRAPAGVDGPDDFWTLLRDGRDAIGSTRARWPGADLPDAGLLDRIDQFDPLFFGITPREAAAIAPEQRILLEVAWEALEHAGVVPGALDGTETGVYVGGSVSDYAELGHAPTAADSYTVTGLLPSVLSGRLAYLLGLRGPALTIDTACSASLVALHLACAGLRRGECDLALAGGVQVMSSPVALRAFAGLQVNAGDGRCKAFAADADGAGWSEGCGVLVLERLDDALRGGRTVLAVIRGSAVNQDGRSQGLTAPNGPSQARVIRRALADARLSPHDIDAVEAHGTGTPLGDPIEDGALGEVFGPGREPGRPLRLGSVKSNIGHTQAAAGVLGVIKMALALDREALPPTLHARTPSPHIDWSHGLALLDTGRPWRRDPDRPRRAGVSSFGISGTNAHVILEEAPPVAPGPPDDIGPLPLLVSGRTADALAAQADRYAARLGAGAIDPPAARATAAHRRSHFEHRAAIVAPPGSEPARDALSTLAAGAAHPALVTGCARPRGGVVFVFPGQGSQWIGMGRALLAESPVFADAIAACDAAMAPHLDFAISATLRGEAGAPGLDRVDVVQPALFAMAIGLAAVWRDLGVEPDAVVGHSQGEIAAAVVAGALSLKDGARVVTLRSRLLTRLAGTGAMAVVELPVAEVERRIADHGHGVSLAVVNTADSTVIAGPTDALETLTDALQADGVGSRSIDVDYASHSVSVEPILPALADALAPIGPRSGRIAMYSTVTGDAIDGAALDADYWCRNLRQTVRLDRALDRLGARGFDVFVEVAPHPVLAMPLGARDGLVVGSLRREAGGLGPIHRALAELHVGGFTVDWRRLGGGATSTADLPTYPFQRRRFWRARTPEAPRIDPVRFEADAATTPPPPEQDLLTAVRQAVSEAAAMRVDDVGADVGLLFIGVDSLMFLKIKNALRARFAVNVPNALFFDQATTCRVMADYIRERPPAESSAAGTRAATPSTVTQPATAPVVEPRSTFVPYTPIQRDGDPSADYLAELVEAYCAPTTTSKARTQADRFVFANNRNIAGFTPALKEMTYQVIAQRARGAYIWDIDDNRYVDLTQGFGASLLGHGPPALTAALEAQLHRSWAVGPIANDAADVARRICQMTGLERAAFYNSGTEAVMVALRLARTVSGRPKIACFEGSYHGMFDGILAIPRRGATPGAAAPMAPGVPESMVADTIVLRYDDPESLRQLATQADQIAGVIVESVQSRRPDVQPRAFLKALREVTRAHGIALIFDEVVTGFRTAPGGAQAWFGVPADIAAYGKVAGGGMPVGIVAGVEHYMSGVDGGMWRYGDGSIPEGLNTFVAGTFCSHPLTMATARAMLVHLAAEGPALQRDLNARTRRLCTRLNGVFADSGLPIHVVHFASLFRFVMPRGYDLLFYRLLAEGVYVWEGRNCFLSTAHSDADIERVVEAVDACARWLAAHVAPGAGEAPPGHGVVHRPASAPQRAMYRRGRRPGGDRAYHVPAAFIVDGEGAGDRLVARIESALTELTHRHEALRTSFHHDGDALWQRIHPFADFELRIEAMPEAELGDFIDGLLRPFDLTAPSLVRCGVARLAPDRHLLVLDAHHLVIDGISLDIVLDELCALVDDRPVAPPPPSYGAFVEWERGWLDDEAARSAEAFWRDALADLPPRVDLPRTRTGRARGFRCAHQPFDLADAAAIRALARTRGVTVNVLLHAVFQVWLSAAAARDDIAYASPTAGRPGDRFDDTVGLFIGLVVYRAVVGDGVTFADLLGQTHAQTGRMQRAEHVPHERIVGFMPPAPDGGAPFEVGFNYEVATRRGPTLGGVALEPHPLPQPGMSLACVLECRDDRERLALRFAHDPDLHDAAQVAGWVELYAALARRLIADPDRPIADIRREARAASTPRPEEELTQ